VADDGSTNAPSGLSRGAVFKSLLVVVLLPYARKKMAELYDRLTQLKEEGELDSMRGKQMIEAFLAVYPILAVCSQSSYFAYQLLYAMGKSKFHDPLQHLCGGFYLTYSPPPPSPSIPISSDAPSQSLVKSTVNGLLRVSSRLLSHSFSLGLFVVQFFDVFDVEGNGPGTGSRGTDAESSSPFSSATVDEYSHRILKRLDALIAPPKMTTPTTLPPSLRSVHVGKSPSGASIADPYFPNGFPSSSMSQNPKNTPALSSSSSFASSSTNAALSLDADSSVSSYDNGFPLRYCPICGGERRNETALSVSGFVFCYECISKYLKQHGVCPITKLPAKSSNLVRLYPGF